MSDFALELHESIVGLERSVRELVALVARDDDSAGVMAWRNANVLGTPLVARPSPGRITWLHVYNPGPDDAFLHLWSAYPDSVRAGTSIDPRLTLIVPANGGIDDTLTKPVPFVRAIAVAATPDIAGRGGDPSQGLLVNIVSAELE